MYKKQQKRWQEQMNGFQQDRGGLDGKAPVVMLRRPGSMASSTSATSMLPPRLQPVTTRGSEGSEGPSPASSFSREFHWETGTLASSEYSQEARVQPSEMDGRSAAPDSNARTVTWLGRHSIYEMP